MIPTFYPAVSPIHWNTLSSMHLCSLRQLFVLAQIPLLTVARKRFLKCSSSCAGLCPSMSSGFLGLLWATLPPAVSLSAHETNSAAASAFLTTADSLASGGTHFRWYTLAPTAAPSRELTPRSPLSAQCRRHFIWKAFLGPSLRLNRVLFLPFPWQLVLPLYVLTAVWRVPLP